MSWQTARLIDQFEQRIHGSAHGYSTVCQAATDTVVADPERLSLLS